MEKKKKLKINQDLLRQLRDKELTNVVGGVTACGNTRTICCTSAGVLTSCTSIGNTSCCVPK